MTAIRNPTSLLNPVYYTTYTVSHTLLPMPLTDYIRDISAFRKPGILFKDITPLLAEPAAFAEAVRRIADRYRGDKIQAIAAAEARGFLFAAPMALDLQI